jgi:hypothetical protein
MEMNKRIHDSIELLKKSFNKKFCLSDNKVYCTSDIINAHTISESFLKNIAEKGHVISPEENFFVEEGRLKLLNKSIRKTKVFNGFCSYHDNKLFSSFEKRNFIADKQQLIDLSFRSICRELYQKKCLIYFFNESRESQSIDIKNDFLSHTQSMIKDLKYLKNGIKEKYRFLTFIIKTSPVPINTAGVMFPTHCWDKEDIQFHKKTQHGFVYNLITLADCSYFIVTTVESKHSKIHDKFMSSFDKMPSQEFLVNYLMVNFLFFNDIFVIKPSWFNSQSDKFKKDIEDIINVQHGNYTGFNSMIGGINFVSLFDDFKILNVKKMDIKLTL